MKQRRPRVPARRRTQKHLNHEIPRMPAPGVRSSDAAGKREACKASLRQLDRERTVDSLSPTLARVSDARRVWAHAVHGL